MNKPFPVVQDRNSVFSYFLSFFLISMKRGIKEILFSVSKRDWIFQLFISFFFFSFSFPPSKTHLLLRKLSHLSLFFKIKSDPKIAKKEKKIENVVEDNLSSDSSLSTSINTHLHCLK